MSPQDPTLFALQASRELGEKVAERLGAPLAELEEREFEDGEFKVRPLQSVRGRDVYVLQSLHGGPRESPNDKLCRLCFFLATLRDAGAVRVTAVVPYLCFARKDRRTKPRDPVTTRYVAALLEASGANRVVALDVHNEAAYQNAFRIPAEHLFARPLFVEHFAERVGDGPVCVVSPDVGGIKRADRLREDLAKALGREVGAAFLEKRRSEGVVSGKAIVGEVEGATAILVDDLIASGTTIARAADGLRERGAARVFAAATHGVFTGEARERLPRAPLERIVITDSIPPFRLDPVFVAERLVVLDGAGLFAKAIARLASGGSLVELGEP